jgi:caffeoyl-CoA O-methyltransferase
MRRTEGLLAVAAALVVLVIWCEVVGAPPAADTEEFRPRSAAELSARVLPLHPRGRTGAEKRLIAVMEDMHANQSRGMGNVLPEDGRLLRMLTEVIQAKHVVEVGTSNGYSAMWFCLALRSTGGKLTTHDLDPKRIAMARDNFKRAGVEDLVTLVEGDAHETVKKLEGPIDVLLLDAEKSGFTDYLEQLLPRVRTGGLIIAHDATGHAHLMGDYYKAITSNPDLETVFVDASRWGIAITRKMR